MVKLTIDHNPVEVKEGTSVMEAAAALGITIPSMCFRKGFTNHPSCMICLVQDIDRDQLFPSCAMPVSEGMNILTDSPEVKDARREALELLLSDHVGDCEAPCRLSCPAFMDIPLMNRLIASGDFNQALRIVREEIALPLTLGYICAAPCEKACKRKQIDQPVSICLLKRSAAQHAENLDSGFTHLPKPNGKKTAIIGAGPAGLAAAFYLIRSGYSCVIFDEHDKAGGAMQYEIPEDRLPKAMLDAEIGMIRRMGAEFRLGVRVTNEIFEQTILPHFDAVILATGRMEPETAANFGIQPDQQGSYYHATNFSTSISGVFVCGNISRQATMAVQSVARGKMAAKQVEIFHGSGIANEEMHHSVSRTGALFQPEWNEYLKESIPDHRVEPARGTLTGFSMEEAMHEARRCLHCDCRKPSTCKLRKYSEEYKANRKRFAGPDRKLLTKSWQHELIVYESEKCIRCGLCVEITREHGESIGLAYAGRGFDVRISVPFNETVREALTTAAEECARACPTGALALKNQEERSDL
jgi:ferredoxin